MKKNKETNVTILDINLNESILNNYKDYYVFKNKIDIKELKKHDKIIFFNSLHLISKKSLNTIIKYLKSNDIDYINITNNMEEVLYTDYLIIKDNESVLIEGKTLSVLKETRLIKRLGFNLPFIVDLSLLLGDYGLINKIYTDQDKLIGELWK